MHRHPRPVTKILVSALAALITGSAVADSVKVRFPQGSAHGFVEVTTLAGERIAIGDLVQKLQGVIVSSRLTLHFFDGSIDDEATVFSQRGMFHFISDHHVQRGPSFPQPVDTRIEAKTGTVTLTDARGKVTHAHIDVPADTYNGMASGMLMNIEPATPEIKISIVVPLATPRIAQLSMKNAGEVNFSMGGETRKAIDYVVHVELGGLAGVVAPLIGKEPADYHVWIAAGDAPAFIREEGQLYQGGPIWRIQQISANFSK